MSIFQILRNSKISKARIGRINTPHGEIETPFFMPDATRAGVKCLSTEDLKKMNLSAFVVNTYHLNLQPGEEIIRKIGGIHKFMNWNGPILSDSGGYQIFSLIHKNPGMGKISEDKIMFKSPLNGSIRELTPEKSIQFQFDLGADMIVCFDDCPPNDYDRGRLDDSVRRTIAWARRCKTEYLKQVKLKKRHPIFFGVIQGGTDQELRRVCAGELLKIGFDGLGFGARPVDNQGKFLKNILRYTSNLIPDNYLRFALGVGTPDDIVKCIRLGWDMFDCVIPTREGRHGRLFYEKESKNSQTLKNLIIGNKKFYHSLNINNKQFANDFTPISKHSVFTELNNLTKSYLHHLFKINETNGYRLASLNNLEFYINILKEVKTLIRANKF